MPEFIIEADPDTGQYEPTRVHLRLKKLSGSGGGRAVEGELIAIEMDREGILKFESVPPDSAEPVLVYDVTVEDSAQADPGFLDLIAEPVQVTFKKRPKDDPDQEPLSETVRFRVKDPTGRIHWRREDIPSGSDQIVEVDPDGRSEMTLRVWIDMWDPVQRKVVYDPDKVEFTHWTGPELDPAIFGPHPDDLPHETAGPSNNRELSRWQSKAALPDPEQFPNRVPPIESWIRVRAWPRGRIDRQPFAIDAHERMLGEELVPLHLIAPRLTAELSEPALPIPADGLDHELLILMLEERDRTRVREAKLRVRIEDGPGYRGGTLDRGEVVLTEKDNGELRLVYTSPELSYEPGKSFTEQLVISRGGDNNATEVARFDLHLSPSVDARIEVEKVGLEFEAFELSIPAGAAPKEIQGFVKTKVLNRYPEIEEEYDTAHAELKIFTGPDLTVEVTPALMTDTAGKFTWELPELAKGLEKAPSGRAIRQLDPKSERVEGELDEDARTVIEFYEEKMSGYAPWHLFKDPLLTDLRKQRLVLGQQLAGNKPEDAVKAFAGTHLLRAGVTFGSTYDLIYNSQFERMVSAIFTLMTETVGLIVNTKEFADWAGKHLGALAGGIEEGYLWLDRWLREFLAGWAPTMVRLGDGIEQAVIGLQSYLGTVGPNLSAAFESGLGMFRNAFHGLKALLDENRGVDALSEVISGAINAFLAVLHLLWAAILAVIYGIGTVLSKSIGGFGRRAGQYTPQAWDAIREATQHFTKEVSGDGTLTGAFTLGKAAEQLVMWMVGELSGYFESAVGGSGGVVHSLPEWLKREFNIMGVAARYGVARLRNSILNLNVPNDTDLAIDWFTDATVELNETIGGFGRVEADMKWWATAIDALILGGEALVVIVATLGSGGLLAPAAAATMSKIEVGFAAAKVMALGIVPTAYHFFNIGAVPMYYAGCVTDLATAR